MEKKSKITADFLGMTQNHVQELRYFLDLVRTNDNGFGSVKIDVKRNLVYRISCTIEGKPINFNDVQNEEILRINDDTKQ